MTFDRFRRDIWPRLKTFPIVSSTLVEQEEKEKEEEDSNTRIPYTNEAEG